MVGKSGVLKTLDAHRFGGTSGTSLPQPPLTVPGPESTLNVSRISRLGPPLLEDEETTKTAPSILEGAYRRAPRDAKSREVRHWGMPGISGFRAGKNAHAKSDHHDGRSHHLAEPLRHKSMQLRLMLSRVRNSFPRLR